MKSVGTHFIVDAWQAPAAMLDDAEHVRKALLEAVRIGGATLIETCVHRFSPHGVTATATLAESHIAIHTWPERGYFAADLFFCGHGDPQGAIESLQKNLGAARLVVREIPRGISERPRPGRKS